MKATCNPEFDFWDRAFDIGGHICGCPDEGQEVWMMNSYNEIFACQYQNKCFSVTTKTHFVAYAYWHAWQPRTTVIL